MATTTPAIRSAPSRRSVFREAPMEEYTPANSLYEQPLRQDDGGGFLRPLRRVLNGVGHCVACLLLLVIMAEFLTGYRGQRHRPQAIVVVFLASIDSCLDVWSVTFLSNKWPGWALLLRLIVSLGYIAMFLVYVGSRDVFSRGYTYWGMDASFAEPVVYLLLWVTGIWDLLHTAVHRHALGCDLRNYTLSARAIRRRASTGRRDAASSGAAAPRAASRALQRTSTPARLERGLADAANITLVEVHADEKGSTLATSRSGSSSRVHVEHDARASHPAPVEMKI